MVFTSKNIPLKVLLSLSLFIIITIIIMNTTNNRLNVEAGVANGVQSTSKINLGND